LRAQGLFNFRQHGPAQKNLKALKPGGPRAGSFNLSGFA
jgi:hypothetical protein